MDSTHRPGHATHGLSRIVSNVARKRNGDDLVSRDSHLCLSISKGI